MNKDAGRLIVSFLQDALKERIPERDIPRADKIRENLELSTLETDDAWRTELLVAIQEVVQSFASQPETWGKAIDLIAIYLDEIRPIVEHGNPLKISSVVLRGLLEVNPRGRITFFDSINEWNILLAFEQILPEMDLDASEAVVLFRRVDAFTSTDMARGGPMGALKKWATMHNATGRSIVEAWLDKEAWASGLDLSCIQVLVEGVVEGAPDYLSWREIVLTRLLGENEETYWGLAAVIACFAWPEPKPPAIERHKALLGYVQRLPRRLVDVGLNALARDARDHPATVIATVMQLVEFVGTDQQVTADKQKRAANIAHIGWLALLGARDRKLLLSEANDIIPTLLDVPPQFSMSLDRFVTELAKLDPDGVQTFLGEWSSRHVDVLNAAHRAIEELFPVLSRQRGPADMGAWVVGYLTDKNTRLRLAAAGFLARKRGLTITAETVRPLSERKARALVHEVAGIGIPGNIYIPFLAMLAEARADVRDLVLSVMLTDAIDDYPSTCREVLQHWEDRAKKMTDSSLVSMWQAIATRIREREERYSHQGEFAELWMTSPCYRKWSSLQNRIFQEGIRTERTSGRHLFLQLAVQVPIARGEGTIGDDSRATPFATYSGSVEFPARDSVDRVTPFLARIRHRQIAAELLDQDKVTA